MAQYATAFREYVPDASPSGEWPARWGGSQADAVVRHPIGDREPRLLMDGDGLLSWNVVDADTGRADFDLIVGCSVIEGTPPAGQYALVAARASGGAGTETAYVIEMDFAANRIKMAKLVAGTRTQLGLSALPGFASVVLGEPFYLRFQGNGTALKARMWKIGESQPTNWDANNTDSAITAAGWIGVHLDTALVDAQAIHYFSVGTNGDPPLTQEEFGRAPAGLIHHPGAILEYGVEVPFVERSDGSAATLYASTLGRIMGPRDLPSLESAPPWLIEAPEAGTGLAFDVIHDRDTRSSFRVRLNNDPSAGLGNAGPHDSREASQTVAGRSVIVSAGEEGAAGWRSFSRLFSGTAHGNPVAEDGDPSELTVDVLSSSGRFGRPLEVKRYTGTPSCLRQMNNSTTNGAASASHIAAYDLTSYTYTTLVRLESLATNYRLLSKLTGGSSINFNLVFLTSSGKVQHRHTVSGVLNDYLISPLVQTDLWYRFIVGVLAGEYAYMLMDGDQVDEHLSPGTPDTQTAAVALADQFGAIGAQSSDVRLVDRYMAPDEAREEFSRLPLSAPSHYALWWKLNETSGATVTDYSSNANNATISGVENTDWERFPTDLGDPELEGRPMPIQHGDTDHFPLTLIDLARERFRGNDRDFVAAYTGDNSGDTFSRGVSVAEVDEGDGVVSYATAQDQPVTAASIYGLDGEHPTTLPKLVEQVLTQRYGLASTDFDQAAIERLHELLPYGAGYFHGEGEPPSAAAALSSILKPAGLHLREDGWGRIVMDRLHPPMTPGPVTTACMEALGTQLVETAAPCLIFGDVAAIPATGDIGSILLWVYPMPRASRNVITWSVQPPIVGLVEHNFSVGYMYNSLVPVVVTPGVSNVGGDEYLFGNRPLTPWKWNFISAQVDLDAGNSRSIHSFVQGESTFDSAAEAVTGSLTGDTDIVRVCGGGHAFAGGIQDIRTGTGGGATDVLIPLSEGSGFAEETVSGEKCALRGARWAPVLDLNLDDEIDLEWEMFRYTQPASKIRFGYRPNHARLGHSDIAASVADDQVQRFTRENLALPSSQGTAPGESLDPVEVVVASTIHATEGAEQSLSYFQARFFPDGRAIGKLVGLDHRLLALQEGDEVRITGARHGLSSGKSFRVIERQPGALVVES